MTDQLRHNANLVDALGTSLRSGDHALGTVPGLLKRVLDEGSWQEFITKRGEHVQHDQFAGFVTTPPLKGLGADMPLIDRIVGTGDPDLLRLLNKAKQVGQGHRSDLDELPCDSQRSYGDTGYIADRLAREAPSEYEAVKNGERTIHAAAVRSGIQRRRIPVRLDDAESAARTLRKYMPHETRLRLIELLTREGE